MQVASLGTPTPPGGRGWQQRAAPQGLLVPARERMDELDQVRRFRPKSRQAKCEPSQEARSCSGLAQTPIERRLADAQDLRRFRSVPVGRRQDPLDMVAFDIRQGTLGQVTLFLLFPGFGGDCPASFSANSCRRYLPTA